ncbi:MAG: hypothetical protein ACLTC4_02135 [Hungatella hathewayi]
MTKFNPLLGIGGRFTAVIQSSACRTAQQSAVIGLTTRYSCCSTEYHRITAVLPPLVQP